MRNPELFLYFLGLVIVLSAVLHSFGVAWALIVLGAVMMVDVRLR